MKSPFHQFAITFHNKAPHIKSTFDGADIKSPEAKCSVDMDDEIAFSFKFADDIGAPYIGASLGEWALIAGMMTPGEDSSPFLEGNNVNLNTTPTVRVIDETGDWGFCIALSVKMAGGTTQFFFIPDPELQVGST